MSNVLVQQKPTLVVANSNSRKRRFLLLTGIFLAKKNNNNEHQWQSFHGVSSFTPTSPSCFILGSPCGGLMNNRLKEQSDVDVDSKHTLDSSCLVPRLVEGCKRYETTKLFEAKGGGWRSSEYNPNKDTTRFSNNLNTSSNTSVQNKRKGPRSNKTVKRGSKKAMSKNSLYHHGMRIYNHRLLTREEERQMGNAMEKGYKLKYKIDAIVSSKLLNRSIKASSGGKKDNNNNDIVHEPFDLDEEWNVWLKGVDSSFPSNNNKNQKKDLDRGSIGEAGVEEETPNPYHRSFLSWLRHGNSEDDVEQNAYFAKMRQSYISKVSPKSPFYESPAFLGMLTSDEIIHSVGLKNGTLPMLLKILIEAQEARQELLKCNMKLVLSIAKRWYTTYARTTPTKNGIYGEKNDMPTLDELVQEGTLGLIKAVDKFDYTKDNRFSTYATFWVTSYVRIALRRAKTSVLKVPDHVHHLSRKYRDLMTRIEEEGNSPGSSSSSSSFEIVAKQLKVKPEKLEMALRIIQPITSLDAPHQSSSAKMKGSAAGGDVNGKVLSIGEMLSNDKYNNSNERTTEDNIDQSILKQHLEKLLLSELSPYERDILRLRMGLDDGKARSIREIADIINMSTSMIASSSSSSNQQPKDKRSSSNIVSMSHVRTTEKNALKRLRDPSIVKSYRLEDFLKK